MICLHVCQVLGLPSVFGLADFPPSGHLDLLDAPVPAGALEPEFESGQLGHENFQIVGETKCNRKQIAFLFSRAVRSKARRDCLPAVT